MTTSGSVDFDLDAAEIIEEAYERCGLEMRTGYDARTARRSMNIMLAEWANRGVNLWTVRQQTTTLTAGTATLTLTADVVSVLEAVIRRDNTDFDLQLISRGEYLSIPNKTTTGRPSQFYYSRLKVPEINLWPTPDSSSDQIVYYYMKRMEDFDTLKNTSDIPFRFLPCMVAGLAYYISLKRAPDKIQILKTLYEEEFQRALSEDQERTGLTLVPSIQYLRY